MLFLSCLYLRTCLSQTLACLETTQVIGKVKTTFGKCQYYSLTINAFIWISIRCWCLLPNTKWKFTSLTHKNIIIIVHKSFRPYQQLVLMMWILHFANAWILWSTLIMKDALSHIADLWDCAKERFHLLIERFSFFPLDVCEEQWDNDYLTAIVDDMLKKLNCQWYECVAVFFPFMFLFCVCITLIIPSSCEITIHYHYPTSNNFFMVTYYCFNYFKVRNNSIYSAGLLKITVNKYALTTTAKFKAAELLDDSESCSFTLYYWFNNSLHPFLVCLC